MLPLHHHGPINARLSFPTPAIGMKWTLYRFVDIVVDGVGVGCTSYELSGKSTNQKRPCKYIKRPIKYNILEIEIEIEIE